MTGHRRAAGLAAAADLSAVAGLLALAGCSTPSANDTAAPASVCLLIGGVALPL